MFLACGELLAGGLEPLFCGRSELLSRWDEVSFELSFTYTQSRGKAFSVEPTFFTFFEIGPGSGKCCVV